MIRRHATALRLLLVGADVMRRRASEVVRGSMIRRRFGRSGRWVFAWRRVVVRSGHLVTVGRTVVIGDDVVPNALSSERITLGDNVSIGRGSTRTCTGVIARPGLGMRIGDRTGISEYCHFGGQGGLRIGSDVPFGPGVRIFTENHRFDDDTRPIRVQGEGREPVTIADDCWIGAGTIILSGVTIGPGSVVGAGSVVTQDVPPYTIVVGNPVRIVRRERLALPADLDRGR